MPSSDQRTGSANAPRSAGADGTSSRAGAGSGWRRVAIALGAFVLVYAVFGSLVLPRLIEAQLASRIETLTGRDVQLGGVSFDPFGFGLEVRDFALSEKGSGTTGEQDPLLAFETLRIDLSATSLLFGRIHLEEIVLVDPRLNVVIDPAGALNLAQLLDSTDPAGRGEEASSHESAPEAGRGGFEVDVATARIEDGWIRLLDRSQAPPFEQVAEPLDFELNGFTTRAGVDSPYSLSVHLGEKARLEWKGTVRTDPLHSQGTIAIKQLPLRLPWDFLSDRFRFEIREGLLDGDLQYAIELESGSSFSIEGARFTLSDLALHDPERDSELVEVSNLDVESIDLEIQRGRLQRLSMGEVRVDGGRVAIEREAGGGVRLQRLLEPLPPAGNSEGAPSDADREGDDPSIQIDRISAQNLRLALIDRSFTPPLTLDFGPISLLLAGWANAPGSETTLDLSTSLETGGAISVKGPLRLDPLSTKLAIEVKQLALEPFQPLVETVGPLELTSGDLSAELKLELDAPPSVAPRVAARGRLQVEQLVALDRGSRSRFLDWKNVAIDGLDLRSGTGDHADEWKIEEITIDGVRTYALRDQDGRLNLETIFSSGPEGEASSLAERERSAPRIEIGRITLSGLGADFEDRTTEPAFAISLDGLSGSIVGLASESASSAEVALEGQIDQVATIQVRGQIGPLAAGTRTDLQVDVSGVSLPSFSAYSARYVGYEIDRGHLQLNLDYRIEGRHLAAKNFIELRDFDFGGRVESAQVTSLPIPLALTLMRTPRGNVEIPLPVEGDLDDPNFSLTGLIGNTFVHLITRVATSPFWAVSGLLGHSHEDLARVDFDPGSDRVTEDEQAVLAKITDLLEARKGLRLDVRGRADPEIDRDGLRRARILEDVRQSVFEARSSRERRKLGDPEALDLDQDEELAGLERLLQERLGRGVEALVPVDQRPKSGPQRTAALIEAAFSALGPTVKLEAADWRALAHRRASAVQSRILDGGRIARERLFLVEVEVGSSGSKGHVPTELSLRFR